MASYFQVVQLEDGSSTKPGVRGFPYLDAAQALMLETVSQLELFGSALDLTARGGALALELKRRDLDVAALEVSQAAMAALKTTAGTSDFVMVEPPELLTPESQILDQKFDLVCLILPADRGNALVRFWLSRAFALTKPSGRVLLAGDKDKGFERYYKEAVPFFGGGEILERSKGLRVGLLEKTLFEAPIQPPSERFVIEARGLKLECEALPGVFSSGKLDSASKVLLEHLPNTAGKRVLDIGAGYGALGGLLALEGARVTMLEDDWFSVQSIERTIGLNDFKARVLHSDVDSSLERDAKYDLIVMNPPFHVGRDVILDVALEFIAAARRHLAHGGEIWLVANHFLPYEPALASLGMVREVARERGFKVLAATVIAT
jgi:16S rRNA (guanine1207-N2)-methyltransferase